MKHNSTLRKRQEIDESLSKIDHVHWFAHQKPLNRKHREIIQETTRDFTEDLPQKFEDEESEEELYDAEIFQDPLFSSQWYLINDGQNALYRGNDIGVAQAWRNGITGKGVTVAILDDGVDSNHPELIDNYSEISSFDFETMSMKGKLQTELESHGTRCAGQIVSKPNNGVCGVGVAYDAKFSCTI